MVKKNPCGGKTPVSLWYFELLALAQAVNVSFILFPGQSLPVTQCPNS